MCGLIISSPLMELLLLQYHRQIIPPHRLTDYKLFRISKMESLPPALPAGKDIYRKTDFPFPVNLSPEGVVK